MIAIPLFGNVITMAYDFRLLITAPAIILSIIITVIVMGGIVFVIITIIKRKRGKVKIDL